METGIYCLNRLRLRHRQEQGRRDARRVWRLAQNPTTLVCTTLAGTNVSIYVSSSLMTAYLSRFLPEEYAQLAATIALAPLALVLAEALPKAVFQAHANELVYRLSWPLWLGSRLLWPISTPLRAVTFASSRLLGQPPTPTWSVSEKRLRYYLSEGARAGVLSTQQDAIARNILRLSSARLRDVMIPLDRVQMTPLDASAEDVRRIASERPRSRLLVYNGRSEAVVGAVGIMDCLTAEGDDKVAAHVRPLPRIPADLPLDEALLHLQRLRQAMAVVVDEQDRAVGAVTMKDLVEEVVGELHDW
jgi:putative hemolysin